VSASHPAQGPATVPAPARQQAARARSLEPACAHAGSAGRRPLFVKDLFYETRALMGRDYTVRRFASEVLGGSVSPLLLGYIEKGTRLPSEALVRRLAAVRKQDPQELLALLWRDRMLHAFGRELRRVLRAPQGLGGIEDAELAVLVSQAIAALPDGGAWIPLAKWRRAFRTVAHGRRAAVPASALRVGQVEKALKERQLIEVTSPSSMPAARRSSFCRSPRPGRSRSAIPSSPRGCAMSGAISGRCARSCCAMPAATPARQRRLRQSRRPPA
jgi:hypothetical protein